MSQPLSRLRVAITGAAGGIGRALAARLGALGANLYLLGRTAASLQALQAELQACPGKISAFACDLDRDDDVREIRSSLEESLGGLDVLIHSAGVISLAPLATVAPAEMDKHYRLNVRAPLLITQLLLPLLKASQGQIVFINSSVGVRSKELTGAYAASKHALKAVADTLRMELNASGIRVLSVYPGNTATPMQRQICTTLGKSYAPEALLQPDDVALAVVNALSLPRTAEITDIHIRPAQKPVS